MMTVSNLARPVTCELIAAIGAHTNHPGYTVYASKDGREISYGPYSHGTALLVQEEMVGKGYSTFLMDMETGEMLECTGDYE